MIRNTIKKTAVSLFALFSAILFFSCTFIHDNKSGKVTFSVNNIIQNSSRAVVTISNTDFLEVSLLGDYTATQTVSIKDASTIIFEEVPLEAEIYAEVYIYRINALNKRYNKYSGKSESLIVQEGDNVLTVKLSAINQEENPQEEEKSVYTVKHLMQNIDDDDYTEDVDLRETLEGKASTSTNAKAKTITGFTAKAFEQQTIQSDDSTVIEIYYNRNVHTIKYIGGFDDVTDVPEAKQYRYGATVKIEGEPIRKGYDFAGWITADADGNDTIYKTDELIKVEDDDITLTATWTNSKETMYKVQHYQQNVDDNEYTLKETENLTGIPLEQTKAVAKSYEGFKTPETIEQKSIAEDGSTIIEIKYDRKTFTVTYEDAVDGEEITVPEAATYRYEAKVNINFTDIQTRIGYTFNGWKDPDSGKLYKAEELTSFNMELSDVVLYAQWTANVYNITYELNDGEWAEGYTAPATYTYGERQNVPDADKVIRAGYGLTGWKTEDGTSLTEIAAGTTGDIKLFAQWEAGVTTYTVHHWQQDVDGDDYTEVVDDKQVLTGSSESETEATAFTYTGFTAKGIEQEIIASDGSTVINVYYNRNLYSLNYAAGVSGETISLPDSQEVRYGATVSLDFTTATRTGFNFAGWKDTSGNIYKETGEKSLTMGDNDVTLTAQWTAIAYNITYYSEGQDITDTEDCDSFPKTYTIEDSTIDLSTYKLNKTGATFVGWYENADLSGTAQTSIQTDSLKDIDLYAKWTYQQTISVTIESGSWSSESTSSSFKLTYNSEDLSDGETITSSTGEITLTVPDLYGYTYTWKVDGSTTDASGTAYSSDNTLTITTTGWKKGIYDISVIATNGTEYQSCFAQIKVGY